MTLVAGVDCSTQATKVLIVDSESGSVVASGRTAHEVTGVGGARETDPEQWWDALADALAQTGRSGEVGAIAIGGQQHGLVVLDNKGSPLRPALLWNDVRAAADASSLIGAFGGPEAWAERIGLVPVASYTVSKWAGLR
ncbi:MAG: xylulokinase, partial [Actinobacteria bacterium]|nr:xylulokinase [Actinomycetota bacterium]